DGVTSSSSNTTPETARGGEGVVAKIVDPQLNRVVARKTPAAASADAESRLTTEARMTAELEHPNIVPVYKFGHDGKVPYFEMRHLETPSFDTRLVGDPCKRTPDELHPDLEVLIKVCDAIAYAHERGIIHRDLKPQNVSVGKFGQAYLLDWGTAIRMKGASAS